MASPRLPREILFGDLSYHADPRSLEPWQILANLSLREANDRPPPPSERRPEMMIGLNPIWTAAVVHYDPRHGRCMGCGDRRLEDGEVCLVCNATWDDPTHWPMQADARPDVAVVRLQRRIRRRRSDTKTVTGTKSPKSKARSN